MSDLNVDLDEIEDISPIPKDTYKLVAKEWEEKVSNKTNNTYIKVEYQVLEPAAYKNRSLWENYTLSANFALVRIRRWVKSTGRVPGILNAKLMDSLMGKPFWAKVGIEESMSYPPQNKIMDFVIPEDPDDAYELISQDISKPSDPFSVSDDFDDDVPF